MKRILYSLIISSFLVYFMVNSKNIHEEWLLQYVGSKTYRLIDPETKDHGGTGFLVKASSGKTYILTNEHVCRIAKNNTMLAISNKGAQAKVKVFSIDKLSDLCLLYAPTNDSGIYVANSNHIGQELAVIGHPQLYPLTLSRGRIIGYTDIDVAYGFNIPKDQCEARGIGFYYIDLSQDLGAIFSGYYSMCARKVFATFTNAITFPGNSGSAVVNFWGSLVGVLFAGDNKTNFGFVVTLDDVNRFLGKY